MLVYHNQLSILKSSLRSLMKWFMCIKSKWFKIIINPFYSCFLWWYLIFRIIRIICFYSPSSRIIVRDHFVKLVLKSIVHLQSVLVKFAISKRVLFCLYLVKSEKVIDSLISLYATNIMIPILLWKKGGGEFSFLSWYFWNVDWHL